MLDGKRVVVVTPAGRRRYMAILVRHVLRLRPVVDEYRVWVNTSDPGDIEYLESLPAQCPPGFLTLERLPPGAGGVQGNASICHFFRNCADENTVYVRFDDDIVCIDDVERTNTGSAKRREMSAHAQLETQVSSKCADICS